MYAASLVGTGASDTDRARADQLAALALHQDPTAVAAASTLGLNADLRGDRAAARQLFAYAQQLSRRDVPTQLWSIEDAVSRANIVDALRWYDATLRTHPETDELLFPVLASASEEQGVRSPLIRIIATRPPWSAHFLNFVPGHASDPRTAAAFFLSLREAGVVVPDRASGALVDALLAKGFYDQAWVYYATIRPDADRHRSRDARFSAELAVPTLLDWVAANDGGISVSVGAGLEFAAPSSIGGQVVRQAQLLAAGTYRLSGRSNGIEQPEGVHPYWTLTCGDDRELARVVLPNSSEGGGRFSATFIVPAGCPMQMLALVAPPSDAVAGLTARLDHTELAPVR